MTVLDRIRSWLLHNRKVSPLAQWFFVTFDETSIMTKANPPGKESWEQSFKWGSIIRVCFKDEGIFASDSLYIFTTERSEAFVIPTEASGGEKLFGILAERGFFPEEIWRKAITSTDGGVYCWPPIDEKDKGQLNKSL